MQEIKYLRLLLAESTRRSQDSNPRRYDFKRDPRDSFDLLPILDEGTYQEAKSLRSIRDEAGPLLGLLHRLPLVSGTQPSERRSTRDTLGSLQVPRLLLDVEEKRVSELQMKSSRGLQQGRLPEG